MQYSNYQSKYGEIQLSETLAMLGMAYSNDMQIEILSSGMEIFVGVLGNVGTGIVEERH